MFSVKYMILTVAILAASSCVCEAGSQRWVDSAANRKRAEEKTPR